MVGPVFHFYAGAVDKHGGSTIPVAGGVAATFREPLGVVGLIVPWNFPLDIATWKPGPALAVRQHGRPQAGERHAAVGAPPGRAGAARPDSRRRRPRGRRDRARSSGQRSSSIPPWGRSASPARPRSAASVMRGAPTGIKRVTLELGGKSANVIFEDADLSTGAGLGAPYAVFDNAGQDCCARSRILVQRSVYDRFVELLIDATGSVEVGDPADESTEMGPLISAQHRETVASFVNGEPLFRGKAPDGPGYWFPCTLVEATNGDRVAREEVFGPVAAVIPFGDEAEAIRSRTTRRTGSPAAIWTRDVSRARARRPGPGDRRPVVNSNSVRARADALRRVQAVRLRPRARDAGARRLLGGKDRVPLDGGVMRDGSTARSR